MNQFLAVNIDAETIIALGGAAAAASAWLVIPWRVGSIEKRLQLLEERERNHAERTVALETKMSTALEILRRIERRLSDDEGPHGNE